MKTVIMQVMDMALMMAIMVSKCKVIYHLQSLFRPLFSFTRTISHLLEIAREICIAHSY